MDVCVHVRRSSPHRAAHAHTHTIPWWGAASGGLFTAMLAWFAIDDLREWFARRAMAQRAAQVVQDAPPIVIGVGGMTCGGCRGKLERMLREEAGVTAVTVSLEEEQASVVGSISLARVREIVESAGFEPRT